jgi:hypothetical protein
MPDGVLVAIVSCPGRPGWSCGTEFEGTWLEPPDPLEENPADSLQLCPDCGHVFTAQWPAPPYRTGAGTTS